jgi:transposase
MTRLNESPLDQPHAMVFMLAKVRGIGIETADMLVNEVLCRNLRDRRVTSVKLVEIREWR